MRQIQPAHGAVLELMLRDQDSNAPFDVRGEMSAPSSPTPARPAPEPFHPDQPPWSPHYQDDERLELAEPETEPQPEPHPPVRSRSRAGRRTSPKREVAGRDAHDVLPHGERPSVNVVTLHAVLFDKLGLIRQHCLEPGTRHPEA